jgi:hypothetical protein
MKDRGKREKERSRLERLRRALNHPVLGQKIRERISRVYHEKKKQEEGSN